MNNCTKHTFMSNDEFDRIISLPDEILQHILSFLGIRKAVQTSLVSKRWVNLWTSLSRLNFDPDEFVSVDEYRLSIKEKKIAVNAKFKEFVDMLLSRREASFLDTFLIKILDKDSCCDLVRSCTSFAMKFNPQVFSMEAPFFYKSECIFSCESIEELLLKKSCWSFPQEIPEVVNLPRIRMLQLTNSRLDNRSINTLFSGCPILEDVSLEGCTGEFSCIFSQKLKYLSLRHCFLHLRSKRFMYVLSSLLGDAVKSGIDIRCAYQLGEEHFVWKTLRTTAVGNTLSFMQNLCRCLELGDYFGGLSDVTVLELHSEDMMSILEVALPKLKAFHNVMDLCLGGWCMTCNFSSVALFLQQTPNLEKITLYMGAIHCRGEETDIYQTVDNLMWVDFSRCKNLKQVHIKLSNDYIRAHKVDKTWLLSRKQFKNMEVVISRHT